jgi:lysophospholipase L1-like esterase
LNTSLLFGSILLFLIGTELVFIFLNIEAKVSLKGLYIPDSRVGYTNNPNFSMKNYNWFRPFQISINSHGLRGPEFRVDQKDRLRILVLGDSITFGIYVEDNETFCCLLEKKSHEGGIPLEVLNGGVDGYWPRNELLWFRSKGIFFEPDIVVLVLFVGNDLTGELREVSDIVVRDGLLYQKNRWAHAEEEAVVNNLCYWIRTRRIYQFICHRYWAIRKRLNQVRGEEGFNFSQVFKKKGFQHEDEAYYKLRTSISGLAKICQEKDMRFFIMLVPTYEQVYFNELNIRERSEFDIQRPNRRIVRMVRAEGIPVLDLLETNDFRTKKGFFLPLERIHLSVEGHRVVAENLYRFLIERGFCQDSRHIAVNIKESSSARPHK